MSDPTLGQHLSDAAHHAGEVVHNALSAASDRAHQILAGVSFSKPAAEVASVAEAVFQATLPAALEAGERSIASLMTAEHFQELAALIGEVNATIAKQYLARLAVAVVATTPL